VAGVSSFGWAGTNAHVILEEANPQSGNVATRPWQLLLLSAQTDQALDRAGRDLAKYLERHPEVNLADVAYTLQVGRTHFQKRQIIICSNRHEAIRLLEKPSPPNVLRGFASSGHIISGKPQTTAKQTA